MPKYDEDLHQSDSLIWTACRQIVGIVERWFSDVILHDKDGNEIDSDHPLDVALQNQWTVTGDSTTGTAKTITKAAEEGKKHVITAFEAVISEAAASTDIIITLEDDDTVIWKTVIGNATARGGRVFVSGVNIEITGDATLNSSADTSIVSLNMSGYTR
jgi:predicted NBD/HSP70 family sugar kinase